MLLLAAPLWTALVTWFAILLLALLYPRYWLGAVRTLAGILMVLGLALCALPLLPWSVEKWVGPGLSVMVLIPLLAMLVGGRRPWRHLSRLIWLLPVGVPSLAVVFEPWATERLRALLAKQVEPALAEFMASLGQWIDSGLQACGLSGIGPLEWSLGWFASLAIGLAIWPLVLVACAWLIHSSAQRRAREYMAEAQKNPGRNGKQETERDAEQDADQHSDGDADGDAGQEVEEQDADESKVRVSTKEALRESDGYCRLYYPYYQHRLRGLRGETGYYTWFCPENDSIVFRASSLFPNPCTERPDAIGEATAKVVRALIPRVGLGQVPQEIKAFADGANVKLMHPIDVPLAKMPWDHPFVLCIPIEWADHKFEYPPGCGIRDFDELPCFATADVSICLSDRVLQAVKNVSKLRAKRGLSRIFCVFSRRRDASDVEICRKLLWNAWRILPGAYEALLAKLVELFREASVGLFLETDGRHQPYNEVENGPSSGKQPRFSSTAQLCGEVNSAWADALPEPLGDLIEVEVLRLSVDTYWGADIPQKLQELHHRQAEVRLLRQRLIRRYREEFQEFFVTGKKEKGVLPANERLLAARTQILDKADTSRNEMLEAAKELDNVRAVRRVRDELTDVWGEFKADAVNKFKEISVNFRKAMAVSGETQPEE